METCAICCVELNKVRNKCSSESGRRLLNAQLNVILTLRDIFELKPNQFQVYLQAQGNPGDWFSFCGRCEEDVNNIRCIYQRLHQISRELERGKCVLQQRVRESTLEHGNHSVLNECRRKFCTKYKKKELLAPTVNPFERGDLLASELALKVKVEPGPTEEHISFNDDLGMFHDENSPASVPSGDGISHAEPQQSEWSSEEWEESEVEVRFTNASKTRRRRQAKDNEPESSEDDDDHFGSSHLNSKSKNRKVDDEGKQLKSKFGLPHSSNNRFKIPIKCPFCKSSCRLNEEISSFSKHLKKCAGSHSKFVQNLKCSLCKRWSCTSKDMHGFLEHVAMCRDKHQGEIIPWRYAAFKCNLCEDSCYLPFPEYTYHVFSYHQHPYGCTQCGFRARLSGSISKAHWKVHHKNSPDTPANERYKGLPNGEKVPLPQIPWWCPGSSCLQQFPDEASRDSHTLTCQEPIPERNCKCSFCGRDYFSEEELLMHRVTLHGYLRQANGHHCKECSITFANSRQLSQHQRLQHRKNLFRCDKCGAEFRTSDAHGSHMRLEHGRKEELEEFTCKICDQIFGQRHELRKHEAKVHEKVSRVCEHCGKLFEDEVTWKYHMASHHASRSQVKPHPCPLEDCQKVLRSALGLKLHMTKYHCKMNGPECICSFCGKTFLSRGGLRIHTKTCRLPRFKCVQCKLRFASRDMLIKHRVTLHGIRSFHKRSSSDRPKDTLDLSKVTLSEDKLSGSCNICKKDFASLRRLEFHMTIFHDDKKAVMCTTCGANFPNQFHLKIHMAKVHQEGFKCDACEKVLASEIRLKRHKKFCGSLAVSDESFPCLWESCKKVFKTRRGLSIHVNLVHERTCTKICSVCGKQLATTSCLRQHMQNIHGEKEKKKLECPVCQTRFTHNNNFKMHLKSHSNPSRKKKEKKLYPGPGPGCCEVCGLIVSRNYYLRKHKADVHGIADFKCDVEGCSKAFLKMEHLEDHKKYVHEGVEQEKAYSCQFCGKAFITGKKLRRHEVAIHLNAESKPFKCELCEKTFSAKEYLSYHLRYTHKIKKNEKERFGESSKREDG